MNGPNREEVNAKILAVSAETSAHVARLEAKMDRMMADFQKHLADNLKWTVGLVIMIIALSMSMLNFMVRSYIDDAVRTATDQRLPVVERSKS